MKSPLRSRLHVICCSTAIITAGRRTKPSHLGELESTLQITVIHRRRSSDLDMAAPWANSASEGINFNQLFTPSLVGSWKVSSLGAQSVEERNPTLYDGISVKRFPTGTTWCVDDDRVPKWHKSRSLHVEHWWVSLRHAINPNHTTASANCTQDFKTSAKNDLTESTLSPGPGHQGLVTAKRVGFSHSLVYYIIFINIETVRVELIVNYHIGRKKWHGGIDAALRRGSPYFHQGIPISRW